MTSHPTRRTTATLVSIAAASLLAACAAPAPSVRERPVMAEPAVAPQPHYGYVRDIQLVAMSDPRPSGAGAVLGAVIGGVVGNQFGSGTGRVAATGVGAVGGAVIGNEIERQNRREDQAFRVTVRMDSGNIRAFDYRDVSGLRVGDRVKVEGGQIVRM